MRGRTLLYEDTDLRAAVRAATDGAVDLSWRFVFATGLAFRPPLAPGIGPAMILPSVRSEAVRRFADDLRARGVVDVERGRRERVRTETGGRRRLRQVTGEVALDDRESVPVEGWVGVWSDGDITVGGGAYPRVSLADRLGVEADDSDDHAPLHCSPSDYRDALLDILRAVD
ncbi:hypothetical protein [Halosimplex salinum]|uniref:hypothetical protein n=1 Tax=Halosimplex salinum TaxID=1710538 RepID=UPI001F2C48D3|nr:hypothetical protein [Halosimplex salinum]